MPTYEYWCDDCNKNYDIIQRITDPKIEECEKCGSDKFTRKISVPTIFTSAKSKVRNEKLSKLNGPSLDCSANPNFRHPSLGVRAVRHE